MILQEECGSPYCFEDSKNNNGGYLKITTSLQVRIMIVKTFFMRFGECIAPSRANVLMPLISRNKAENAHVARALLVRFSTYHSEKLTITDFRTFPHKNLWNKEYFNKQTSDIHLCR